MPQTALAALQFEEKHHSSLLQIVAAQLECSVSDIVDFELNVCDTQDGVIGGRILHKMHGVQTDIQHCSSNSWVLLCILWKGCRVVLQWL